jgi:hypothetical protein
MALEEYESFRPKKKSTSQFAQNAAKSLIGAAWTKFYFTLPIIRSGLIFSTLAGRS